MPRVLRIDPIESEVDRLLSTSSTAGFEDLGHFCRTAAAAQYEHRGKKDVFADPGVTSTSAQDLMRRWVGAQVAYRNWEVDQAGPRSTIARAVASPDGMFETSGPDGGSLVPPFFVKTVFDKVRQRVTPFSQCRLIPVSSNAGVFPGVAETSLASGSRWGGMQSYWEGEAQQGSVSHPALMNGQYRLKKLFTLIPVTSELFEDSDLLQPFLDETVHKEFLFDLNNMIVNGVGVGAPLGTVKGPATISVAKDTNQATKTISASNVSSMWIRSHGPSRANACWFANEEFDPDSLGLPTTPLSGWQPSVEAPTLKGRPVFPLEQCQAIGTPGDLILADYSQHVVLMGAMRKQISMHFKFDYFEHYLKFVYRVDSQPLWFSALTSLNGTVTKSPFVILQQR
jgi:HK97 family phage major capsid protein